LSSFRDIQIAKPSMDEQEWLALKEPLESGWLTQGPKVAAFEQAFAEKHQVKYAKAVSNCTTALHLALLAVGVKPGDAVIVPSFTWVSTANAVEYCGAKTIFCDIEPHTYNMDPYSLEKVIEDVLSKGETLKAVIPVHLFGLCADMDSILKIAQLHNLAVVEDAACASGSSYKNYPAGSMGDVGCFSFHPRKVLVTGEGGMCTTNNESLAEKINCLRNHGASLSEEQRHHSNAPYLMADFDCLGYNYRMSDLQGAVGLVQLEKLDGFIAERDSWATYYDRELSSTSWLSLPARPEDYITNWQAYVCRIKDGGPYSRDQLLAHLHEKGISCRAGTQAVHSLGYYRNKYQLSEAHCPESYAAYKDSIALPLHNHMTEQDYIYIISYLTSL
jgi:perosamine synthetase